MPPVVAFLAGLVALVVGAELLVRGGSRLAERLGVSPMVVGVTVVAFGTSVPELAIGIDAAVQGSGALVVGNIAGTNILNILLILGLVALVRPVKVTAATLRVDLPTMVGVSVLALLLALDGTYGRIDGGVLLLVGVAYATVIVRGARHQAASARRARREAMTTRTETGSIIFVHPPRPSPWKAVRDAAYVVGGLAVILVGADWLVSGAVDIATALGVSEAVIGLTIVALGTSAPELATAVVALIRGVRDLAIGNLLGSSIYNLALVLGLTVVVSPAPIGIEPEIIRVDLPVMVATAVACIPVFVSGNRIRRLEGAAFVTAYFVYLAYLLIART
ncbi:sodium:calcium antiporter [Agromyces rhizosphaerae]|uniref:Sodium:calcium antiporter n=1 Tax=Agromyces rhizosphaerae TaxID=88374 RepID=A0A9W6CZ11_9MICO|nr:calcium/sodium antiporter [Agromyces rhizosphaerae]GLI28250.1 sodium:calcium antiporter [Agromyces rhizosphaerae]